MSELHNVIFRGDILPGHTLADVKVRLAQLLKLDDSKLASVFSGKPVIIKRDCDAATAEKIRAALAKAGAHADIVAVSSAAPTTATPAAPATPTPPASQGLKVAPVGQVMTEAERAALRKPPVQVSTDHIKLERRASSFLAADEVAPPPKRPEIQAPTFGLSKAGEDLLKPEEKRVFEELALDLSTITLAERGADILPEDQKIPLPLLEVEELAADLAPVGSDMGQVKRPPPPPPPKTDHLKLV